MSHFFLPAPLGAPEILAHLGDTCGDVLSATAAGHSLRLDPGSMQLRLVAAPGVMAGGWLLDGQAPAAAAAAALLAGMGGASGRIEARLADGSSTLAEARIAGEAAGGLEPGEWSPAQALQFRQVVREFLAQPGRDDAEAMARLLPAIAMRAAARVRGAARSVPRRLGADFGAADQERLSAAWPYGAFFAVEEHRLRHRRFDGSMTGPLDRAVFVSGDAVTVLPFDPARGTVLLVEQFRAGPAARLDPRPWSLEAVAGRCDGLEAPEETARREAEEEAGLRIGRLERAASYYTSPGIAAEYITSFIGEADLGAAGGLHGLEEEDEDIRALVVPLETALAAAEAGEIANAPLLVSLHWLARHRDRLVAAWAPAARSD